MAKAQTPARARRASIVRVMQKVQHAVPGVALLGHGISSLTHGAEGWHQLLAIAEVLASVAVFVTLASAIRQLRKNLSAGTAPHIHTGIDWVDIFLGCMLFTEVWSVYLETGHLARPTILLGVVMMILGVFGGKFIAWKQGH